MFKNLYEKLEFNSSIKISTIEAHTGGEPLRVIVDGFPKLKGDSILLQREYAKKNHDDLRKFLMYEPRGHADMYGAILTFKEREDSDFGVLFIHNEGFSTMCGHAIIALSKIFAPLKALETGSIEKGSIEKDNITLNIDTPCGLVKSYANVKGKEVSNIHFISVVSFVYALNRSVNVNGMSIEFDIAYGGAFYAFVDADSIGLDLSAKNHKEIIELGKDIKKEVVKNITITHPDSKDLSFLYGVIFTSLKSQVHSKHVCIFADGELDRSPTGSGVSARVALLHKKNELRDEEIIIESIIGTTMSGSVSSLEECGSYSGIRAKVGGDAYVYGKSEYYVDEKDPLKEGFIFR